MKNKNRLLNFNILNPLGKSQRLPGEKVFFMLFEQAFSPELGHWLEEIEPTTISRAPRQITIMGPQYEGQKGLVLSATISNSVWTYFAWVNSDPRGLLSQVADGGILLVECDQKRSVTIDWESLHQMRVGKLSYMTLSGANLSKLGNKKWYCHAINCLVATLAADSRSFFQTPGKWLVIKVKSDASLRDGFQSSTALAAALVGGFSHCIGFSLTKNQAVTLVQDVERQLFTSREPCPWAAYTTIYGQSDMFIQFEMKNNLIKNLTYIPVPQRMKAYRMVQICSGLHSTCLAITPGLTLIKKTTKMPLNLVKAFQDGNLTLIHQIFCDSFQNILCLPGLEEAFRIIQANIEKIRKNLENQLLIVGGGMSYQLEKYVYTLWVHQSVFDFVLAKLDLVGRNLYEEKGVSFVKHLPKLGQGFSVFQALPGQPIERVGCGDILLAMLDA